MPDLSDPITTYVQNRGRRCLFCTSTHLLPGPCHAGKRVTCYVHCDDCKATWLEFLEPTDVLVLQKPRLTSHHPTPPHAGDYCQADHEAAAVSGSTPRDQLVRERTCLAGPSRSLQRHHSSSGRRTYGYRKRLR